MSDTDWKAIRTEYEKGELSQSAIAKNHGISRTAIQKKAMKEGWQVAGCRLQVAGAPLSPTKPTPLPIPADAIAIARIGLSQLARHLQTDALLPITSHKSISDALAQYVKVLVTAPTESAMEDGLVIQLERLLPETRLAIRQALADDKRRQLAQEEGAG